ncbi:MAG: copper chaperone PCu(A)C [Xanthobacteraceae bacterium]|nr:copper chaperone PCu(A)C [Xanthobacteraceae bacterium]
MALVLRTGLIGAAVLLTGGLAAAESYSAGGLQIGSPWTRATPKGSTVSAGYLSITNKGTEADRLIGGSLAPASRFEVHTTVTENGVARMRQVTSLEIKPGETVELKPGGMHVMFMGLKQPLTSGQTLKGTLVFEKAGTVAIEFVVQAPGATSPAPGGGHKHH